MIGRLPIAVLAVAGGIAVASLIPEIPQAVRDGIGLVVGADRMRAASLRKRASNASRRATPETKAGMSDKRA
jgi:hypothetical protein